MRKLGGFNFITMNGFYKGPGEEASFSEDGAMSGGVMVLTYQPLKK